MIVVLNSALVKRHDFKIRVPYLGMYQEIFKTEMEELSSSWTKQTTDRQTVAELFKQFLSDSNRCAGNRHNQTKSIYVRNNVRRNKLRTPVKQVQYESNTH